MSELNRRLGLSRANYVKGILARLVSNFPGLITDEETDGAEVIEWLSQEFWVMKYNDPKLYAILEKRALRGTPKNAKAGM